MWKFLLSLFLAFIFTTPLFAAQKLRNLEISYDNYYAKINIRNDKIKFEDPYLEQVIRIKKCNRAAFNSLVAELSSEAKDYELLVNTKKLPNKDDDVILKRNGAPLRVTRQTSLGSWSQKIGSRWNDLVALSQRKCEK